DRLLQNPHGGRRLHGLEVAVVAGAGPRCAKGDAALAERTVLGAVAAPGRPTLVAADLQAAATATLLRVLRERRQAAVRRIGDERGAGVDVVLDHPELIVVAGLHVVGRQVLPLERGLHDVLEDGIATIVIHLGDVALQLLELRFGDVVLAGTLLRTLEGRDA